MADAVAQRLLNRFSDLEGERSHYEDAWQKIADYELGRRDFQSRGKDTPGRRRDIELYDTTAQTMASLLASGLHSLLTNPATEWFTLKPENDRLLENHDVALWIEYVERVMHSAFQKPKARFSSQIHETYIDLVSFGTGGIFVTDVPGENRLMFSSRPISELYIAEDPSGIVDTVMRRFEYTHRQASARWGPLVPDTVEKAVKAGKADAKAEYLHVVMPADDPMKLPITGERLMFDSFFVSMDDKRVMERGGFHEMPYMISRWEKDSGEVWGRGPGWNALADAKLASTMKKTVVQAGEMAARPPVMVDDDGVVSQGGIRPGARISVRPSGGLNPPVQPLDFRSNASIPFQLIQDTRQQIQEAFLFELLQLIRDPRMTATQVLEISANIQRVLSPILGRIQTELLEPIVDRVFALMLRAGKFPTPPEALQEQELKIEYVSPVARAQRSSDTQAIVETFTFAANLANSDPSVLDVVNSEEAVRFMAAQRGTPASVLRSREDVEQIREAQRAQAEQAAALEKAEKVAQITGTLAPAIQGGAPVQ